MGIHKNKILEFIGYDARSKAYAIHSYNNMGEISKMKATHSKRGCKFEGADLRFGVDFNVKKISSPVFRIKVEKVEIEAIYEH